MNYQSSGQTVHVAAFDLHCCFLHMHKTDYIMMWLILSVPFSSDMSRLGKMTLKECAHKDLLSFQK